MRRSKILWAAGLICLAIILGFAGYRYYQAEFKVEPEILIKESLASAQQARSYRYQIDADYTFGTRKQPWTHVTGEKSDSSYHFKGSLLETPTEIYQIGSRSYTLDPVNKNWYILDGTDLTRQNLYFAEIDPLSNFRFKAIVNPKVVGTEQVNRQKCWVLEFQPQVDSQYLDTFWKNFSYRLWVNKKNHVLAKGIVAAENKNSPGTFLSMTVIFQDFNKKITINPPE